MSSEDRDRQMTVWIAEKVMGWRKFPGGRPFAVGEFTIVSAGLSVRKSHEDCLELWNTLTSVSDAMDALEAWQRKNRPCAATIHIGDVTTVTMFGRFVQTIARVQAYSRCRAICEALCKATGFEG